MIAGEVADDRIGLGFLPWQPQRLVGKFRRMRDIKRRRQRRLFTDLVRTKQLGNLDNSGAAALEILNRNCAVGGAQVYTEAKTCTHLICNRLKTPFA